VLDDPGRYAGTAILYGTLPFEAGVPTRPRRSTDVRRKGNPAAVCEGVHSGPVQADLFAER
jgi:phospholipase/carboxylesterase